MKKRADDPESAGLAYYLDTILEARDLLVAIYALFGNRVFARVPFHIWTEWRKAMQSAVKACETILSEHGRAVPPRPSFDHMPPPGTLSVSDWANAGTIVKHVCSFVTDYAWRGGRLRTDRRLVKTARSIKRGLDSLAMVSFRDVEGPVNSIFMGGGIERGPSHVRRGPFAGWRPRGALR
jgi:hypothetical protein